LKYAAMVAKKYSTEHHELIVRPDAVGLVERLVRHFDEPFADTAAIPTFVVSEFAAQHVKVVLTGDGGDELFGGYDSFRQILARQWMDAVPHSVRRGISAVADWLPYSAYGKNYLKMMGAESALDRYFESNYTPFFLRRSLVDPEWMIPPGASYLVDTLDDCFLPDEDDALTQAINFEATANLAGDMLVKVDRMSMANSLEVRCPLLDHEVAELAFSIPISLKIRGGRGKYILVKALGDRLPRELLDRPKMGFGVPLASWFKGPLRDMLQSHLTSPRFLNRGIVSPSFVRAMLNEHQSGRRDNHAQLWSLLMLELWFATVEQGS